MIRRFLKTLFFLGFLAAIGLAGFAYFGDLPPKTTESTITVVLDAD